MAEPGVEMQACPKCGGAGWIRQWHVWAQKMFGGYPENFTRDVQCATCCGTGRIRKGLTDA